MGVSFQTTTPLPLLFIYRKRVPCRAPENTDHALCMGTMSEASELGMGFNQTRYIL